MAESRRHYHLVRARTLALLQRRDYSLATRMLALGLGLSALMGGDGFRATDAEATFDLAEGRLPEVAQWLAESGLEESGVRSQESGVELGGPHRLLPRRLRTWIAMPNLPPRFRRCLDRAQ